MSAKGLPPAVRLDPLLPQYFPVSTPSSPSLHHNHHPHLLHSYECTKQARPPPSSIPVSSLCIEASTSGLGGAKTQTPPISSPNDHEDEGRSHIAKPRGLTLITTTPSSSRAHIPASSQLLPLPPALCRPPLTSSQLSNITNRIRDPRVEPVDLEPLLPMKREASPKVMAVIDDEAEYEFEKEREERLRQGEGHLHQDRDDNERCGIVNCNRQLPTPHTTPVTQALDTPDNTARDKEPGFQCASSCTGKVINFPSLQLDHGICPMTLDEPLGSLREGKDRDVERGRKREKGPSRFRDERRLHYHRPGPYDIKSRPLTRSSPAQQQTKKEFIREIDGVAAILLAAGMDVDVGKSRGQSEPETSKSSSAGTSVAPPHPHEAPCATSTTSVTPPSPAPSDQPPQHQERVMSTTTPTPEHGQAPSTNQITTPPPAIRASADEIIHVFRTELEFQLEREHEYLKRHLSLERRQFLTEIQCERQCLERARADVQREREELRRDRIQLERERAIVPKVKRGFKAEVERDIRDIRAVREENEMLRLRVGQLEKAGALGSGVNGTGRSS